MSCVICARISTAPLTRKWASWAISSGRARTSDADQGTSYLFKEFRYPQRSGAVFTCDWVAPIDKLTERVPDGTVDGARSHYSCRSMTGSCAALAALADEPGYAQINTADAARLGIEMKRWCGSFARQNHNARAGQRSPKQRGGR